MVNKVERRWFPKETLTLLELNHPNIATVFDFDTQAGTNFLMMKNVPGKTFTEDLSADPLSGKDVVRLGTQISEALEGAHKHGIIRRDLHTCKVLPLAKGDPMMNTTGNPGLAGFPRLLIFSLLLLMGSHPLSATPDHTTTPPVLLIPRVGRPPTLEDFLGMKPDGGTEKRVTHRMKQGFFKQPEYWERMTADMQADIDRRGVLCLTESPDNLMMWDHYASGHAGVCLKFRHLGNDFFERAQKVHYSDEPRTIDPFDGTLVGFRIALLLITKPTSYAHEEEWRIVDYKVGSGVQKFPPELLCGVILGMKIGQREREQICTWARLRSHPTELLQARERHGELVIDSL